MPDIFLSYSPDDTLIMQVIRDNLRKLGFNVWIDSEILEPGTPQWMNEIERAIHSANCMLVLCSPAAKQSMWVDREIHMAKLRSKFIIPLLIYDIEVNALPPELLDTQYLDMRGRSNPIFRMRDLVALLGRTLQFKVPQFELETSDSVQIPVVWIINITRNI